MKYHKKLCIQIDAHRGDWRPYIHPVCLCVLVCVFLYLNTHSTSNERTFLGSEDILAGPPNLRGLFEY